MKRYLCLIALILSIIISSPVYASSAIYLDEEKLSLNNPPITENNRILVPLRTVSEALGCEVQYDEDTQTIRTSRNGTFLRLTLGSNQAYVNNKPILLDIQAKSVNGITMVPLRFVTETLGLDVKYEKDDVYLTTSDYCKVHFIDVGNGDAIYIKLPNNQDVLIDAGDEEGVKNVLQCLRENNVDDIELLISTHPHEGQMGGLPWILEKYKVEHIIDSGAGEGSATYKKYQEAAKKENSKWEVADKQKLKLNGATLEILTTFKDTRNRDVDGAGVVSLLTVGNIKILFMADVSYPYDTQVNLPGTVQVVKAANMGGQNSTSQQFLDKAKPETVVISVSKDNAKGFPNEDTLERIKKTGAGIARTSLNGTIVISTNGKTYKVDISKNETQENKKRVEPPKSQGLYLGDKNGDVFHWPGCRKTDDIKLENRVWFTDANHAKDNQYQACQICRPE